MKPSNATTLRLTAIAAAALLTLAGCGKEEPKPAEAPKAAEPAKPAEPPVEIVKIGHAAPLTGGIAHLGKDNENGVRLAVDERMRKVLQKTEYPGDKYVCVLVEVEIDPHALVARHTHPGVESSYIVSGASTLSVKGQPDRELKTGDGFQIPPEVPHSVRNGPGKTIVSATYIVEKDKPLASPAPE